MVVAGIQGGNPQSYGQGKKVLTNALLGIIILFGAWIGIDTIMKGLGAYSYAQGAKFGPWHVIECQSPQLSRPEHFACNGNKCELVDGLGNGDECIVGGPRNNCIEHSVCNTEKHICEVVQGKGLDNCSTDNGGKDPKCAQPLGPTCKGAPGTPGEHCPDANIDTSKPAPSANCSITGGSFGAIDEGISRAGSIGGDIDTVRMVHAIISQESHGDVGAISSAGACGIMQIKPSSGKRFANRCGATEAEASTCSFYTNPANVAKSVCIGTLLLKAPEVLNACGRTIRGLAAGYNGGGGGSKDACAPSVDCGSAAGPGECKVSGDQTGETKRWECLWEDTAHASCNAGRGGGDYSETRKYVPKVWYCYDHL